MVSVCSISDLHLFCGRSRAHLLQEEIYRAAGESEIFVLNGDIIDFRWSVLGNVPGTILAAIGWLDRLCEAAPRCQFHYVLGNHDYAEGFQRALDDFCLERPNFTWHSYLWRIGDAVFLHGDVAITKMRGPDLRAYRDRWLEESPRGRVLDAAYDAAFRARIPSIIHRTAFRTTRVTRRVAYYLNDIGQNWESGARHVFFGHTHVPIDGVECAGLRFFNGGAALPGSAFHILRACIKI